jgi:hypothetical protein
MTSKTYQMFIGGVNDSGYGRSGRQDALDEFTELC